IPAYNEQGTIAEVIKKIPRDATDDVKVIVVDDGSIDNSAEVAYKAGADMVVSHVQNLGLAATYRDSLEVATEQLNAEIIVNIDADGQYEPNEIPRLIQPILDHKADIVLGSRFEGHIEQMKWSKKAGNRLATRIVSRAAGQKFSDCQTGFRALSREAAFRMNVFSNFTYTQESLVNAIHHNMKVVEIPVTFYKRQDDFNRLFGSVWNYAKRGGATLIRTYLYYKPLRFFLYIGVLTLIGGLILGLRVLIHYLTTTQVTPYLPTAVLASLLTIVGFQVILFGLIGDMIRINQNLHEEILYRIKKEKK
ncbi:MAG: glycosyltransferase, partial [Candidatus Lokiarchaeota archaeon]|nr:glycosyltransferase [Candidatus Lokiarchaeota archaeon]